jgi:CheY-like chemotaxis protein
MSEVRPSPVAKPRVLVVDDEPDALGTLEILLQLRGYCVVTAADGAAALEAALQQRPEVIITDITMPTMTGAELCTELRSNAATANSPIIVCSGVHRLPPEIDKLVNRFLRKPIDFDELDRVIQDCLPS